MWPALLKKKTIKDFMNESAIHGLRLLLYHTPFKYARLIWSIFLVTVIIWTQFIIISLTWDYIQQPTEVHFSTSRIHVSSTPFPGVAVCSPNKLNHSEVMKFAEEIFVKQQIYKPNYVAQTTEEMAEHLLILNRFFVFPYDNKPFNLTVIQRLDELFTFIFNTTNYPVRYYIKKLAPDCESLIIRGAIYGASINTSLYFRKRMTSSSICCMFNYNRKSYSTDSRNYDEENEMQFESSSVLNSIQFVLRTESHEFTTSEFRNTAFQLYIFPRNDYATIQSHRIGEILVDYNTIVEIPIEPQFSSSREEVRQFAPTVRNCYFPDEGQQLLNRSFYSIDECLLLCRMDSMIKYCGCVTPPMADTKQNETYCNFLNLPCLMKWKAIWYGWNYFEYVHEGGKDIDDDFTSQHKCPKCLPSCNGVNFNLEVNEITLSSDYGVTYNSGILKGLNKSEQLAIVKLFFKRRFVLSTEMGIVGDWVVLLNRFGGIMSLMYGFSIMSFIEIIYFATGKFFVLYLDMWKSKLERNLSILTAMSKKNATVIEPPPPYNLYWNEIKPQVRLNIKIYKREKF